MTLALGKKAGGGNAEIPLNADGSAVLIESAAYPLAKESTQLEVLANVRTVKALDILLVGGAWVVRLKNQANAPIASVNIGSVAVSGAGAVALPLDLVALGGSAATEIRVFGAGVLSLIHATPANADFPVAELQVEDGEVVAHSVATIHAIGAGITRLALSWGA